MKNDLMEAKQITHLNLSISPTSVPINMPHILPFSIGTDNRLLFTLYLCHSKDNFDLHVLSRIKIPHNSSSPDPERKRISEL